MALYDGKTFTGGGQPVFGNDGETGRGKFLDSVQWSHQFADLLEKQGRRGRSKAVVTGSLLAPSVLVDYFEKA